MYFLLEVSNIRGRGGRWTLDHMYMYLYMYVYDAMYLIYIYIRIVLCNCNFSLVFIGKEQNFIATLPPLEVFSTNNSVSPPFPLPHALELGLTVRDRYNSNQYVKGHVSCCKNKQKKGEVCGLKTSKNTPKHFVASFFQWKIRTVLYCSYWAPIVSCQTIRHVVKKLSGINNNSEKHPKFWCMCVYIYIHTHTIIQM